MSDKSESFWDNLRREIKAIGTDTRASDMRRFKAYMIDRVFAMEQGVKIREALLKSQEEKLQAAEKREKILMEAVERASKELNEECSPVSVAHDILDNTLEKLKESEGEE